MKRTSAPACPALASKESGIWRSSARASTEADPRLPCSSRPAPTVVSVARSAAATAARIEGRAGRVRLIIRSPALLGGLRAGHAGAVGALAGDLAAVARDQRDLHDEPPLGQPRERHLRRQALALEHRH